MPGVSSACRETGWNLTHYEGFQAGGKSGPAFIPSQMPGLKKAPFYPWPYHEALRLDEAMNELTLLATGVYGNPLLKQHGAPVRLLAPGNKATRIPSPSPRSSCSPKNPAPSGRCSHTNTGSYPTSTPTFPILAGVRRFPTGWTPKRDSSLPSSTAMKSTSLSSIPMSHVPCSAPFVKARKPARVFV